MKNTRTSLSPAGNKPSDSIAPSYVPSHPSLRKHVLEGLWLVSLCALLPFQNVLIIGLIVWLQEATTGQINLSEEDPEIFAKFVRFIYTGNYDDEDHLDPQNCDDCVLQSVDDLTFSLRHGTDIPGLHHYDAELWDGMVRTYNGAWGDAPCRCVACMCYDCQRTRPLAKCEYHERWRRLNLLCDGSSEGEEYLVEGDVEEVDEGLEGGLDENPAGYLTELPHAMLTSVRMYAMADMFCVPALKVLARNRFYKAVEQNMDAFDFPDIVDEVFATTGPDDWGLKDICVLRIRIRCFGIHEDPTLMENLQPIFCKHEEFLEKIQLLQEMERRQHILENEGAREEAPSEAPSSFESRVTDMGNFSD